MHLSALESERVGMKEESETNTHTRTHTHTHTHTGREGKRYGERESM